MNTEHGYQSFPVDTSINNSPIAFGYPSNHSDDKSKTIGNASRSRSPVVIASESGPAYAIGSNSVAMGQNSVAIGIDGVFGTTKVDVKPKAKRAIADRFDFFKKNPPDQPQDKRKTFFQSETFAALIVHGCILLLVIGIFSGVEINSYLRRMAYEEAAAKRAAELHKLCKVQKRTDLPICAVAVGRTSFAVGDDAIAINEQVSTVEGGSR